MAISAFMNMHQMARSSSRTYKTDSNPKYHTVMPVPQRAVRAIPHVKLMNQALRRKDRVAAIENGRAAISEMSGIVVSRSSAPVVGQIPGDRNSENPNVEAPPTVSPKKSEARAYYGGETQTGTGVDSKLMLNSERSSPDSQL